MQTLRGQGEKPANARRAPRQTRKKAKVPDNSELSVSPFLADT
jgi:hypothetical protein